MRVPEFIRIWLEAWAFRTIRSRPPNFIIRPQGKDQTLRWWIIPKNKWFNIYLHKFVDSDDDRALHDHPWANASILISGEYIEWVPGLGKQNDIYPRKEGYVYFRKPSQAHRVELYKYSDGDRMPVITLFITGPRVRNWGFLCPKGWRKWEDFCDVRDHGVIGKGCND